MHNFLSQIPLFSIVLTVGAFQIGLWCQKKTKSPLCNPILIGTALVIGVLLLTDFDPQAYQEGTASMSWLLTPATVCLAVPLSCQLKLLKRNLPAILAGITAGTLASLACILLLCRAFGLQEQLTVSLLPKSVTVALGLVLSEGNNGIPALTSVAILITGILGNLSGSMLCKILRLKSPVCQGVAFGTASHIVGTARANEIDPLTGAVSSLSLVVAGVLTTLLFPLVLKLL